MVISLNVSSIQQFSVLIYLGWFMVLLARVLQRPSMSIPARQLVLVMWNSNIYPSTCLSIAIRIFVISLGFCSRLLYLCSLFVLESTCNHSIKY